MELALALEGTGGVEYFHGEWLRRRRNYGFVDGAEAAVAKPV